jgi:hypothetical protein
LAEPVLAACSSIRLFSCASPAAVITRWTPTISVLICGGGVRTKEQRQVHWQQSI